jgi:sugar lactone lactonase YvrE
MAKISPSSVELVCDARAELGEGPVWDERRGHLLFLDISRRQVHVFDPATGNDRVLVMSVPVSAIALASAGDWIAAGGGMFLRIDPETGEETPVAQVEAPERRTRMNDGAVDPGGRFWAGSMSLDGVEGQGTLYRLDPDGTVHAMLAPVTTSNGPAWSPDGRTMYYVDTRTRRVDMMDYDVDRGVWANRRTFVDLTAGPGRPDGVIVDREGGVWVGLWLGSAVHRYHSDGTLDMVVPIPTAYATKCAFGGADLGDLYVTTARGPLDDNARAAQPGAGGLFRLRPGVFGLPASRFRG